MQKKVYIDQFLKRYLALDAFTGTADEKRLPEFLINELGTWQYFKQHTEYIGIHPIKDDALGRDIFWALRKGQGDDTVILFHHGDVVNLEDYGTLSDVAFLPKKLKNRLIKTNISKEIKDDINSGEFMFGRGTADMKGGGTIQIALLKSYCEKNKFKGNVLLLAVVDEENMSAGMRGAVPLLMALKQKFALNYRLAINSEPHERIDNTRPLISLGSIGKLLYFVYIKGVQAHIGKNLKGVSPMAIFGRLIHLTDQNARFVESFGTEKTPPPIWVYLRDDKTDYDASMPSSVYGCFSVLGFKRGVNDTTNLLRHQIENAVKNHLTQIDKMNAKNHWQPHIMRIDKFLKTYPDRSDEYIKNAVDCVQSGKQNYVEATQSLLKQLTQDITPDGPLVIYGIVPPVYPSYLSDTDKVKEWLSQIDTPFDTEAYFTGISDISYMGNQLHTCDVASLTAQIPFYNKSYTVPLDAMSSLQIPAINIGPWGKDLHLKTERVHIKDLYVDTPNLIDQMVHIVLSDN